MAKTSPITSSKLSSKSTKEEKDMQNPTAAELDNLLDTTNVPEEEDPFAERKGRAIPHQDLRTVPLNTLLRKVLNGTATPTEQDHTAHRMTSIHAEIYAKKQYDNQRRASMDLWNAGVSKIVQARRNNQRINLNSLLSAEEIEEFIDHNVGNQEHLGRLSTLDLANIAVGFRDPEDRYAPWTRGLYALAERFINHAILEAGPTHFSLRFPAAGEDEYWTMTGDGVYDLLSHADPETNQAAPGTSACVLYSSNKERIPNWDSRTMVIRAGAKVRTQDDEVYTLEHDIRVTMPPEVYAWSQLTDIDPNTFEHQNPRVQADTRIRLGLRTTIVEKYLGGHIPQNGMEIDYAEAIYRYSLQDIDKPKAERNKSQIFGDGRWLKGMKVEDLKSLDVFIPAWTTFQQARNEQKKAAQENYAKRKAEQRAQAIANRQARENGQQSTARRDEQPIFAAGTDPLGDMDPELLP
jgi:hypothetical protein